jgi:hypothetical protein
VASILIENVKRLSPMDNGRARVQWGAMRHGIAGIDGNSGILESVTYKI